MDFWGVTSNLSPKQAQALSPFPSHPTPITLPPFSLLIPPLPSPGGHPPCVPHSFSKSLLISPAPFPVRCLSSASSTSPLIQTTDSSLLPSTPRQTFFQNSCAQSRRHTHTHREREIAHTRLYLRTG